jgi:glycosyltransferase involved in cell wall biosynthesis
MTQSAATSIQKQAADVPADLPFLSIIVPCFNEEKNLPVLYDRLKTVTTSAELSWRLILVDDHSDDDTFLVAGQIAENDQRVTAIRLAKNVGSHLAALCGLTYTDSSASVVMAADLQDPPELLPDLVECWRSGIQVVWAVRESQDGKPAQGRFTSYIYNSMMMRILDRPDITSKGADFFLIDRLVVTALRQFGESNISLFALLQWMGFRQGKVVYQKEQRLHGRSGWSLRKKLKLFLDSITAFSFAPIRIMSGVGMLVALLGFIYAATVIENALVGQPVEGWSSIMVTVLILGGLQIMMLGILGEYLWRSLDETRKRPRYLIEDIIASNAPADTEPDTERLN